MTISEITSAPMWDMNFSAVDQLEIDMDRLQLDVGAKELPKLGLSPSMSPMQEDAPVKIIRLPQLSAACAQHVITVKCRKAREIAFKMTQQNSLVIPDLKGAVVSQ